MTVIIKEVYDAFFDAGASDEKATAAAKAVAGCGRNFASNFDAIKRSFDKIDSKLDKIETDLLILKWMAGLVLAVNVLPMLKALFLS